MIFVTLGSQNFQFNRLLKKMDELIENGVIKDKVFAQTGFSDYAPKNYDYKAYMTRDKFAEQMAACDLVVTHGGTGAIIGAVKNGKKVIAIPRLAEFEEHVDDHQMQIVEAFSTMEIIEQCLDLDQLDQIYQLALTKEYKPYVSNTKRFLEDVDGYIMGQEMKKIHVIMAGNHSTVKGGISSVVNQILGYDWSRDGIDMTYVATYRGGNAMKKILVFLQSYLTILSRFIFKKPEILYMHMSYRGSFHRKYLLHRLARSFKVRTIIHLHGSEFKDWYDQSKPKVQGKIRRLLKESEAFIVLGDKWLSRIQTIEEQTNTLVLNNTVHIPDNVVSQPEQTLNFLFLGVLIPRKGVADLLEAIKLLKDKGLDLDNVIFQIAGSGPQEDELHQLCGNLGIQDSVDFLGWVDPEGVRKAIKKAHVFVLPSYNEGLPIAILEAISFGMPVVATDVGDVSTAVLHGDNGYLFEPGDKDQLASLLTIFIEDQNKDQGNWQQMSHKSRSIAEERFDEASYFAKIRNLIRTLD